MLNISLPPSPINLFLIYAVCYFEIKLKRTFSSLFERAFEVVLVSMFNKEIRHQFFMYIFVLSFFVNLIITCLYEMLNSPLFFVFL